MPGNEPPYLGQDCVTPYRRSEVLLRGVWSLVQATLFRWSPRPLHAWRAFLLRAFGADIQKIGEVVVFPTAQITFPWKLTLSPRAMVGPGVILYNPGRITLGRGANISQRAHLCAGSHDYRRWSMPLEAAPITIGANVWIAAEVFVGPGVEVGELSVVGARSVVVRSLPAQMICVGNPCRPVRPRDPPAT